jgi:hypothetical protein
MPAIVLTVNDVFMQFIEHIDSDGCSGNFTDVLKVMAHEKNRKLYEQGRIRELSNGLACNLPIPWLMVSPEHQNRIKPLLASLHRLLTRDL